MINKENVEDILALSPMQEGILFHYLQQPTERQYFEQLCIDITGDVSFDTLKTAWQKVVQDNPVLRTVFRWEKLSNPVQIILKEYGVNAAFYDLSGENDGPLLQDIKSGDIQAGFDLTTVAFRVLLVKTGKEKYSLIISNHHILYDGWSNAILLREFFQSYRNISQHLPLEEKQKSSCKEFIREIKQLDETAHQRYWTKYLAGIETTTALPFVLRHKKSGHKTIETLESKLTRDEAESVNNFVAINNITLASLVYAAWGLVLGMCNGTSDVIFGVVVSGRKMKIRGIEDMTGLFINTIPLRLTWEKQTDAGTLLQEICKTFNNLDEFEHTPLVNMKKYGGLKEGEELFDSLVVVENYPFDKNISGLTDFSIDGFAIEEHTNYDLVITAINNDELEFEFKYNANAIEKKDVERLLAFFNSALLRIISKMHTSLSAIDLLSASERDYLLQEGNAVAEVSYPSDKTIIDLFETQVALTPTNIAVVFEDKQLTYKELNERSNQLGGYLRDAHGIQSGDLVGILQERSEQMIIAILGVLKAGATYVPLDPAYPQERISYMLSDSQCRVVLDTEEMNRFEEVCGDYHTANLSHITRPEDVAYVIYTSGSTGRPKGVMIEHRNVVRLLKTDKPLFDFNENDVWTMFHSFCFDFSVWEMYGALLTGGRLVQVPAMTARDPEQFISLLIREGVTVLNQTPGSFYNIVSQEQERSKRELNLRYVIFGGEALQPRRLTHWHTRYPEVKLINMYGITETTVHVTYKEIGGKEISEDISNIGKPIPTLSCYVLDQQQRLLPVGIFGELYVGGAGVGRGYLNNDTLTATRFIHDPFVPGGRLYRTGDRVRLLSNGELEYGGRLDDQVKIRGYRIELGEISAALDSYEEVISSVVIIKADLQGDKQLIAYFTGNSELSIDELRQWLEGKLPAYMVPAYYVQLESIPLTVNGKVDKKQLPDPAIRIPQIHRNARNEKEEQLVSIWSSVLGIEVSRISIDSNFFELGGHSLKATALLSRIHKDLGVRLPLSSLFSHPTIEGISTQLGFESEAVYESIPLATAQPVYPLSAAQRRMYVLHQLNRDSAGYNMPVQLWLPSSATEERLVSVFTVLISRHESLRTSFEMAGEEPVQRIHEHVDFKLSVYESSEEELLKLQQSFVRPFDLSVAPLLRVAYVKLPDGRRSLLLDMHHIITDGVSQIILEREFSMLYEGLPLSPVRLQYKDYSEWQHSRQQQESLSAEGRWWHDIYKGTLPVLSLPYDHARPVEKQFAGRMAALTVQGEAYIALQRYCREEEVTPYMYLLSVISIWLSKLSGEEDIIIGSPVSGRRHADVEGIMGLFVNTLALRTQPSSFKTYREYLQDVRSHVLGAYERQDYGFEELVDHLQVHRELNRNPVFDVMFVYQPSRETSTLLTEADKMDGHAWSQEKFDLTLSAEEGNESIRLTLSYDTSLFESSTIDQLIVYLQTLLSVLSKAATTTIGSLDILPAAERDRLLYAFNDTALPFPEEKTLVDLFESRVALTPDNIAVVFEEKELSYRELNNRAAQWAGFLTNRYAVAKGDLVGVMVERSEEMIAILLGILKTGAAYVPLDPSYPASRISYVLSDSRCKVLVDANLVKEIDLFPVFSTEKVNITANDLAYVIYTSGSTGTPKGVMIEHRNAVSFLSWCNEEFKHAEYEEVYCVTSICFDLSIFEIFFSLLSGKRLRILENGLSIAQYLPGSSKVLLNTVPSVVGALLEERVDLRNVSVLNMAGEPIPDRYISPLLNTGIELRNLYGPTESTTYSTSYRIVNEGKVLIGRPVGNTQVYILSEDQQLQPAGVTGEICLSGAGLARGYLNQPELTASKFISHPFHPGERLYCTGDLGRWLPDGNLDYLGRKDDQVKIRGYRIEPGEIVAALESYEGITSALVLARIDSQGEKRLIAYILSEETLNTSDLRSALQDRLPGFMIPDFIMQLAAWPLTDNGKIDKKALPNPETYEDAHDTYVAPTTAVGQKLAGIWEYILNRKNIGLGDNFFELGGHSLRAIRLSSLIQKNFGVNIPLAALFRNAVLEDQVTLIGKGVKENYITIPVSAESERYRLSSAQKRIYFLQEFAPAGVGYNIPTIHYLGDTVNRSKLEDVISQLIDRHQSLRTSFVKIDNVPWQQIHTDVKFTLDEHECDEDELNDYISTFIRPFDLSQYPLMRSSLVKIRNKGYLWLVDIHHIISDGTSNHILVNDFLRLYNGQELAPLTLQYRDYSEWQNTLLESGTLDIQKQYWLSNLSALPPKLNLLSDHLRPPVFTFEGARHSFILNEQQTSVIRELQKQYGASLQMILLSVLKTLLYKYTGADDLIIGCAIAGRRHPDTEHIVGMFVNMLAIRTYIQAEGSFSNVLEDVIKNCLTAYEHQDIQFEDLVDMLLLKRDPSRNPLFDISLVVQNFERFASGQSDLPAFDGNNEQIIPTDYRSATAKFDMSWIVVERDEDIHIDLEYYTAIYDEATIESLSRHFVNVLDQVLADPRMTLSGVRLLNDAEEQSLLNIVAGERSAYPSAALIHTLFEQRCLSDAGNLAVVDENGSFTYGGLNELSGKLAAFLNKELLLTPGAIVGILQKRSKEAVASMLGVLKAGGAYLPLDSDHPEDRLLYTLEDAGVTILLTEKSLIEYANRLQWRSKGLRYIICVDTLDVYETAATWSNELMRKDLWDLIGDTGDSSIARGGWKSSFTGDYISDREMSEYSENAYLKLKPHLHPGMKVLEIGCSSGLTMFRIAPEINTYWGTDLSSSILAKTRAEAEERGQQNILLACLPAHEIDLLAEKDFDLVIINSVIQCFGGYNYLRDVLKKATAKLKDSGLLFLGDLMDEDKREELIADLNTFNAQHKDNGFKTKTDFSSELFISRDFLNDLQNDDQRIAHVEYTEKIYTIPNELTRYRYDALLSIDKNGHLTKQSGSRNKYQFDLRALQQYDGERLSLPASPGNKAYVIYTSGSTGKPKGVVVEHSSLINLCYWHCKRFQITGNDRATIYAGVGFDASVWEIFPYLITGASLYVVPDNIRLDIEALAAFYENNRITVSFLPTAIGEQFLSAENSSLRYLLLGGDKLTFYTPKNYSIINNYGPTENTVVATCFEVTGAVGSIPIGRPIDNTAIYLLDEQERLVPIGGIGEICITGDSLFKEYLNNPSLTGDKVVSNPFRPGQRMYKTGDLGKWLPDGNIVFAGRKDDQVKIRGYRIELAEIEHILQGHPNVESAVVLVKTDIYEEKQLVAYLLMKDEPLIDELLSYLKGFLPDYMLPAHFIRLDAFPLTSSGKIDRRSLPDPVAGASAGSNYVAPRNEIEAGLVRLWEDILDRKGIGVKDDFFQCGGHSLRITRLSNHVHRAFGVKVPLADFFTATILEEQAILIVRSKSRSYSGIQAIPERDNYILSSSQRRLWILSQFKEAAIAYNIAGYYEFEGQLDIGALSLSFEKLIHRHESLRTVFREDVAGELRQVVLKPGEQRFRMEYTDLRKEAGQEEHVQQIIQQEQSTVFDLLNGPLLRTHVLQTGDNNYIFCCILHHIIGDGWSMKVMMRELTHYYRYILAGKEAPIAPLRLQYRDYAVWEQQQLSGAVLDFHRSWWQEKFSGELPVLALAGDHPRPPVKTYHGGNVSVLWDRELTEGIKQLVQQQGATLFMGLLASVNILLYKYTGQDDLIIGTPVAGREHADLEDQIGFYVNTLALRSRFTKEDNYISLLHKVRALTLDAYEHQIYPFDALVNDLNLKRDTSRNALFDVMVILQNIDLNTEKDVHLEGVRMKEFTGAQGIASQFDLTFNFKEQDGALLINLSFNKDIYNEHTAASLLAHLRQLLQAIIAEPVASLGEVNCISVEERERLLHGYNNTGLSFPEEKTLVDLFESRVALTPDNIAVVFEEKELSYQELNNRAAQWAGFLTYRYAVGRGDLVGVMVERSEEMIAILLGILKTGAAYVPLDPSYPASRISYVLSDSRCKVLVDANLVKEIDLFPVFSTEKVNITANDLAYVIYTSGSTGTPKGVMIEHRNAVSFLSWCNEEFKHAEYEEVYCVTSICFDLSIFEIFFSLLSGKRLRMLENGLSIAQYLPGSRKVLVNTVPSVVGALLEEGVDLGNVSVLNMAGEPIPDRYINPLLNTGIELRNLYGPTESTTYSTSYRIVNEGKVLIGRPVGNTQVYILSEDQQLQPVGVTGEICLSGAGLARGYLNQPELTASKFISHPFHPGERLYRTGDLGRWLPDGNLDYLGRKDDQVKIRGYRIEPGEIVAALESYEGISGAVVLTHTDEEGNKKLVAYLVSGETLDTSAIGSYLKRFLPAYMVPSYYVSLTGFPLNANGKIDKKKLLELSVGQPNIETAVLDARDDIERDLVTVFKSVLKKHLIGARSDFFALGGDSIKSIQVVSRLRQKGYILTIRDILLHPVIEELAAYVKKGGRTIEQGIITGKILLSPIQRSFFSEAFAARHHFNQSVLLYRRDGIDGEGLQRCIDKLVLHHDALRMVYRENNGIWEQENLGAEQGYGYNEYEVSEETAFVSLCEQLQQSLDLYNGPLFRVALFHTWEGDRLLLLAHHLVIDGVSWRILLEDLSQLYVQHLSGSSLELPDKTDSFQYWQQQQQRYADSVSLQHELSYWSEQLSAGISVLPKDNASGRNHYDLSAEHNFILDEAETSRLKQDCYHAYRTDINDILVTALVLSLGEVFGLDRVSLNLEGHGRETVGGDTDVSRTIGWFTSLYPVNLNVTEGSLLSQLIMVKEHLHRVPNKGIGYGLLRYLRGDLIGGDAEVTFNYLGDFGTGLSSGTENIFDYRSIYHGRDISGSWERNAVLDISGMEVAGKLSLSLIYSREQYESATIQRLSESYLQNLRALIDLLSKEQTNHLTPVDLTWKGLSIKELNRLTQQEEIEDIYRLSPLQEGLYYHWQMSPGSLSYHEQLRYEISGAVDIKALESSYRELISRHDVLRTRFYLQEDGTLLQIVRKTVDADFRYKDITGLSGTEYREVDRAELFNLHTGALMRLSVFRLDKDRYEFIWSHHHILMDGWCISILTKEFFQLYKSKLQGHTVVLPKVVPYSGYIDWLADIDQQASLSYWKRYLSGFNNATSLPMPDKIVPKTYLAASKTFELALVESQSIRMMCKMLGITESSFIQTVWAILLAYYNKTNDVVFGAVVSGRPEELRGVEEMVGLFINTVPVRIRLEETATIETVLREVRQAFIEGTPYHYTQLAKVQAISGLRNELFDHLLVFENFPVLDTITQSFDTEREMFTVNNSDILYEETYDFVMTIIPQEVFNMKITYNANRYDESQIYSIEADLKELIRLVTKQAFTDGANITCGDISAHLVNIEREKQKTLAGGLKQKNLKKMKSKID